MSRRGDGRVRALFGSLGDRARQSHLRLLGHPRFQRWAARFPLTRAIARRRAAALFDLSAGFVYSQVLFACVQLRLLERLAHGSETPEELAEAMDLSAEAMERLLEAARSLGLVERRAGGRYGLGLHGASYMGNPGLAAMVEHHALLYRDLSDPVALLRGRADTELRRFWAYAGDRPPEGSASVAPYSELMARSVSLLTEDILEAYPFAEHRELLDVGGGEGAFVQLLVERAPGLRVTLFDLPPVAERAQRRLAAAGLADRAAVVAGDVFRDPLPGPVDAVSLLRVLHDHDDGPALAILRAARAALRPGGTALIAEPMRAIEGAEPVGDAYFGFYLLAMGQGRPRSADEIAVLLRRAGFCQVERRRTRRPMLCGLLTARA